jgi:hypothetical protein
MQTEGFLLLFCWKESHYFGGQPLPGTTPTPSLIAMSWLAAIALKVSRRPLGQTISTSATRLLPRPKWSRGSFAE